METSSIFQQDTIMIQSSKKGKNLSTVHYNDTIKQERRELVTNLAKERFPIDSRLKKVANDHEVLVGLHATLTQMRP